jgi:hypothetical protein
MLTDKKEGRVWQKAYDETYSKTYATEHARLIAKGKDEKESRIIAHSNADQQAKDIADAALSESRVEKDGKRARC